MNELILFTSTFVLVFAFGIQSQSVNQGHYRIAFFNSFIIGTGNIVLYKLAPEANATEIIAYLLGGPLGITASMYVHRRFVKKTAKTP